MAAWVRCIVTVVVQQSYHINKTETVCTLLTSILNVPLVPGVHRSRHTLLLSEHSSDVECISDELYIITRQPSCGLYPTTQPQMPRQHLTCPMRPYTTTLELSKL